MKTSYWVVRHNSRLLMLLTLLTLQKGKQRALAHPVGCLGVKMEIGGYSPKSGYNPSGLSFPNFSAHQPYQISGCSQERQRSEDALLSRATNCLFLASKKCATDLTGTIQCSSTVSPAPHRFKSEAVGFFQPHDAKLERRPAAKGDSNDP